MNKYLEILQMFVSTDDLRIAMTIPNIGEKVASATDAHSLVFFDKDLLPKGTSFEKDLGNVKYPEISFLINKEENQNTKMDIELINSVLNKCPLIEDTDEEEKEDECSECDGTGKVEFEYDANDHRTYYKDGDCPICDGEGTCVQTIEKPNGKMVRNNEYFLQINNCYVSIFLIERLLEVSKILNEDIYIVTQTESNKEIVFKIGEVKVMIMPLMRNEVSEYCLGNIA